VKAKVGRKWPWILALVLLVSGTLLLALGLGCLIGQGQFLTGALTSTPTWRPTATEPILPPPPTRTPLPVVQPGKPISATPLPATVTATPELATAGPTALGSPQPAQPSAPSPSPTAVAPPAPLLTPSPGDLYSLRQRLGVGLGGGLGGQGQALANLLGFGWYVDWAVRAEAFRTAEVEYVPMIRLSDGRVTPDREGLLRAIVTLPGALWLIGNEPDVKWQDNVSPEVYAELYHDLYALLKEQDPSCQVAIGGVSQPTPLRLRYLDRILQAYHERYGQPMPVDVWNVHNFILREERDSWGVDIPPGMDDATGQLYEIADHDDLGIFRQQIVDFRHWMKERGQQEKPLIVTEYGILMPAEYGFPLDAVERFMLGSFEFFRTASDPSLGYPDDGYRLVQRWCWFSLVDARYPTGNLVHSVDGRLTPLGEAFAGYALSIR
jgi:hypothetical protein